VAGQAQLQEKSPAISRRTDIEDVGPASAAETAAAIVLIEYGFVWLIFSSPSSDEIGPLVAKET